MKIFDEFESPNYFIIATLKSHIDFKWEWNDFVFETHVQGRRWEPVLSPTINQEFYETFNENFNDRLATRFDREPIRSNSS